MYVHVTKQDVIVCVNTTYYYIVYLTDFDEGLFNIDATTPLVTSVASLHGQGRENGGKEGGRGEMEGEIYMERQREGRERGALKRHYRGLFSEDSTVSFQIVLPSLNSTSH